MLGDLSFVTADVGGASKVIGPPVVPPHGGTGVLLNFYQFEQGIVLFYQI